MSMTSGRLLAVAIGLIAGLILLAAFATRIGLVASTPPEGTPVAVGSPTPTRVPGARVFRSLSELSQATDLPSGTMVEVRLDEASLGQDVAEYLRGDMQGVTVSNTRVRLRPGEVIFTGSVRRGVLATEFTLTSHPEIRSGRLVLVVDSLEPGLVSQFSPIQAGQTIDLAPKLEARSVTVVEGLMVVVGVVR